jgi:hypothetical protein
VPDVSIKENKSDFGMDFLCAEVAYVSVAGNKKKIEAL